MIRRSRLQFYGFHKKIYALYRIIKINETCLLEEYAQDNNDTSYIFAAYFSANVVLIMLWGHTLQCMFEEYEMHVSTYMLSVLQRHNLV